MVEFWVVEEFKQRVNQLQADCESYAAYIEVLESRVWELESKCQELDSDLEETRRLIVFNNEEWALGR